MILDFDELRRGQPLKTKPVEEQNIESKFYRLGYQTSKLESDRALFEREKQLSQQELEQARQALMDMQIRQAAAAASAGAVDVGIATGMGMAGMPIGQPGMPPGMPPGMGAPPPMVNEAPPQGPMDLMAAYQQM